jgi:hypothetical protein
MANYRRTATGNWSTLAQWQDDSTGSYVASTVLPGTSDVVYANGFTVTLDIDIAVLELRTTSSLNVTAGGFFDYGNATTVIANIYSGSQICLRQQAATTKILIGNVFASNAANAVNINNGGLIVTGNVTGGSGFGVYGITFGGGTTLVLNGNCFGGTLSAGVWNNGGVGVINGVVTSSTNTVGFLSNNGTTTIDTVLGGLTNAGAQRINGDMIVTNAIYGPTGFPPTIGITLFNNSTQSIQVTKQNLTTQTLVNPSTGFPTTTDVRDGISYASGSLIGSLLVPPPSSVAVGVPVDNTTGTAIISISDMGTLLTSFKIS